MSTTFRALINPVQSYAASVPEPTPAPADPHTPAAAPDPYDFDHQFISYTVLFKILDDALRPFPGALLAISQSVQRYMGKPVLYPVDFTRKDTPA